MATNPYTAPQSRVADVNRSTASGVTTTMIEAMRGTKPWVLLIGIVLIIFAALVFVGTIFIVGMSAVGMAAVGPEAGVMLGVAVFYGLIGILYLMLAIYLIKYSSAIGRFLISSSTGDMEAALVSQKKFWKLSGIITLVMIVLTVIGSFAAISIPAYMGYMNSSQESQMEQGGQMDEQEFQRQMEQLQQQMLQEQQQEDQGAPIDPAQPQQ